MRKSKDPNAQAYADFAKKSKSEQREILLSIAERCVDGAPVGLARRLEIYLSDDS